VACSFPLLHSIKSVFHSQKFQFTPEQLLHRDRLLVSKQPYDLVGPTLDVSQPITLYVGLCRRRRWPEPLYESFGCSTGYTCVVRVNNREYQTDGVCDTEKLARENAAMRAYLICRNFSVNDGMYPAGHDHGGIMQGIPVAIGTGRRSRYTDDTDTSTSGGSRSGGSSPESYDGGRVRLGPAPSRALAYGHRRL
jgi:Double-stranded RNA binding motif